MPVVANICLDFLKRDMQHVYRQITGLGDGFDAVVLTRRRENAELFPFDEKRIAVLPRPRTRGLRRFWFRTVRRRPVPVSLGEVGRMLEELQRLEADVVHVWFGHVAVHLLPFLRACPRPVVVSFHGADAGVDVGRPAYRRALGEVLARADLVLARSRALLRDLEAVGGRSGSLRLHRTGIPLESWGFVDRASPPEGGRWRFLQACRLIEKKGLPTSMRAFATIAGEHPAATFTIAGDGPMEGELRALAAELGIADRVDFAGFVDPSALRRLMEEAHLFLHPSRIGRDGNREGVPNAMLEAMASGLPVLATWHGGIPEAVEDGVSGCLVEEDDHERLAARALEVMARPELYRQLAVRAREEVLRRFDRAVQARELACRYREAAERFEARGRRHAPWGIDERRRGGAAAAGRGGGFGATEAS